MWQLCHFLFRLILWFFWESARIGESYGDEEITIFGENTSGDFVKNCFTQYGEFFGDLQELVKIKVKIRAL